MRDFLEAKKLPETLRVWVNTYLGETWEETGEGVADEGIADRREEYEGCPEGVVLITAGVDVQDDRIECEIVGWGRDEESWSLGYQTIYGDPSGPAVWGDLEAYLNTPWHPPPPWCRITRQIGLYRHWGASHQRSVLIRETP